MDTLRTVEIIVHDKHVGELEGKGMSHVLTAGLKKKKKLLVEGNINHT